MTAPPLTPPEAFVLLDPEGSSPAETLKVAVLSLIAAGVLTIQTVARRGLLLTHQVPIVSVVGMPPGTQLAREVVRAVRHATPASDGTDLRAVAASCVQSFGQSLRRLKPDYVLPSLVERGWLTAEPVRVLWLFPRVRHRHTAAGLAEVQRIKAMLAQARRLPALLRSDPAEARAIALAAGPLLLLVPELKPHYRQLAALNPPAPAGADGSADGGGDASGGPASGHDCSFDLGCFGAGSFDMDFGSFESSFDSSFSDGGGDAGSGDAGGDGGGGDGGGGDGGGGDGGGGGE